MNSLPGITQNYGGMLAESCAICLNEQGHISGVNLQVEGCFRSNFIVEWSFPISDQMRNCYNDSEVATENGAYGIAFLILLDLTRYKVIERSKKGTGFDYWLGKEKGGLFQDKVRLEVSGIRSGNYSQIRYRVSKKITQIRPSNKLAPAYVVVVEFSKPISTVEEKWQTK
ncbi:MAG: hypothetical protein ACXADW_23645 [Candidatus Hodarchaeales archaeon]